MTQEKHHQPPRIAALILGWLLKDDWDTRAGDYEEYYSDLANLEGEHAARWWYRGQLVRLLPGRLYDKFYLRQVMLKNYFLLGFRTLRKNKVSSTINIVGLSAAVGCVIALFLFIQEIFPNGDFHENGDRVFLVGHEAERGGDLEFWGITPAPLGPALAADFPQIERAVRFADHGALVQSDGSAFRETVSFADVGFFDMLSFPLRRGLASSLENPSSVIISSEVETKYFGDQDPMGQPITVTFENGTVESFVVGGVAEAFPRRSSMRFDFLVGYDKQSTAGLADLEDWATFTDGTFLQLRRAEDLHLITEQLDRYVPVQNQADDAWQVSAYFLDNIWNPDLIRAWATEDRMMGSPPLWEAVGMGLVGLLVLLISCFNYITISLAAAARRLKEIGIRKAVGAEKRQLVLQFLTENLVLCSLSLLGGLFIAWGLILPLIENLTSLRLQMDFESNLGLWVFLVSLLAFIGLVSGAYPAFYISSFQPVEILRGKLTLAEKKGITRTLTTVQFVLTIITICISTFVVSMDDTLTAGDWGYNEGELLVMPGVTQDQYAALQRGAVQLPSVRQVVGAEHHIGASLTEALVQADGTEIPVAYFGVGHSYLNAMGLRVKVGRTFGEDYPTGSPGVVVINQTLAETRGWADPLGQQVRMDGEVFSVIGVVDDFLLHPLAGSAHPAVFGLSDESRHSYLTVRVEPGASVRTAAALRTLWEQDFREASFEYYTQSEVFQEYDFIIGLSLKLSRYLGLFALFISCMGLFGMASQRAAQRVKEIGVRKAMGASALEVVLLVNRGFLVMLGIAALIATPLCYLGLSAMLSFAPADIQISAAPFVLANVLVFLLAAVSLSMQTRKLVQVNPAKVLRYE
jgi:putative ABC transport system permease protein